MSDKKKPSGFFYRKRKALEALQNEKQSSLLKKFLTSSSNSTADLDPTPTPNENTLKNPVTECLFEDPGQWPEHISDSNRQIIVSREPVQIKNYDFPLNSNGRRFTTNHYQRKLSNGERVSRNWLIYSILLDSIFCFCCRLFSGVRQISLASVSGYSDWTHLSQLLSEHEKSPAHMKAYQLWMEL